MIGSVRRAKERAMAEEKSRILESVAAIKAFIMSVRIKSENRSITGIDYQYFQMRDRLIGEVTKPLAEAEVACREAGMEGEADYVAGKMYNAVTVIAVDIFSRGYDKQARAFVESVLIDDDKAADGVIALIGSHLSELRKSKP
jgi:hypothetical protein